MTDMEYIITIGDGAITKTLTVSPFQIKEYVPREPERGALTIAEPCALLLTDTDTAANLDEIDAIDRLFDQAMQAQIDPSLARVYVTFRRTPAGTEYRSEIVKGRAEYDRETLRTGYWDGETMVVTLIWERRFYWEASTAVQLPLTNRLGSNNTTGLRIYNPCVHYSAATIAFVLATFKITDTANGLADFKTGDTIWVVGSASNDGAYTVATGGVAGEIVVNEALANEGAGATVAIIGPRTNYLQIAAADVAGVLDAPIRLELVNDVGAAIICQNIHTGISWMNELYDFNFILEGEGGIGGVQTEDAGSSGGKYAALTWAVDTETELWTHDLSADMLASARGSFFQPFAVLRGGTIAASIYLRLNIKLGTVTLFEGPLVGLTTDDYLQPLGLIQLPPYLERFTLPQNLTLSLRAKQTGGGVINLDFIEFIPVDCYRPVRQLGYAIPNGDTIYIDELFNPEACETYGMDGAFKNYSVWIERGTPLMVKPSRQQQIHILFDESDHTLNIGRKLSAKAFYRPRRLAF